MKNYNNKVPNEFSVLVGMVKEYGIAKSMERYADLFQLGDYLRAARIARGETQEYVAVRAEIDRTCLSRIELNKTSNGRHGWPISALRKLSKYYGLEVKGAGFELRGMPLSEEDKKALSPLPTEPEPITAEKIAAKERKALEENTAELKELGKLLPTEPFIASLLSKREQEVREECVGIVENVRHSAYYTIETEDSINSVVNIEELDEAITRMGKEDTP